MPCSIIKSGSLHKDKEGNQINQNLPKIRDYFLRQSFRSWKTLSKDFLRSKIDLVIKKLLNLSYFEGKILVIDIVDIVVSKQTKYYKKIMNFHVNLKKCSIGF